MKFAVNYSPAAAELARTGAIAIDLFKCPDWPDLIETVQAEFPLYVHFSLKAGLGFGDATDKSNEPPNWFQIERLLRLTETPFVNLHLNQKTENFADVPANTSDPTHIEFLTECALRDVQAVVDRFGPERVIVENVPLRPGETLYPVVQPQLIHQVVAETGCGFLFDVSHARIAAHILEIDEQAYVEALPLDRTREIHVTGLQIADAPLLSKLEVGGVEAAVIDRIAGWEIDHVPLTGHDWAFFEGVMAQVRGGRCGQPQIVAFEFGGLGSLWEALMDRKALVEQAPRLYALVNTEDEV